MTDLDVGALAEVCEAYLCMTCFVNAPDCVLPDEDRAPILRRRQVCEQLVLAQTKADLVILSRAALTPWPPVTE